MRRILGLTCWAYASVAYAQDTGSEACVECHAAIARSYARSPMSRSSGPVSALTPPLPPTALNDPSTGAAFRIEPAASRIRLIAERAATGLQASRDLTWFIGSGRVGRSFLFGLEDGWLYQSPVSWYSREKAWLPSPGFQRRTAVDLTRAVEPACLLCHASRLQHKAGTQNQYDAQTPFLEGGIGCERCHGAGARHVALMRKGSTAAKDRAIVNPAKLPPAARDSVCAQCHLTGAARVARLAGKGRASWKPGEDLAGSVAVFVWSDARDSNLTVTSHFEKLAWSRCKEASGDRLWCGTCHDPHGVQVDVRARCVVCHSGSKIRRCSLAAADRQAQGDACQACHMPQVGVSDAEHAVYTDHSIPRRAGPAKARPGPRELVPFFRHAAADPRDLALGYAVAALNEPAVRRTAFELLRSTEAKNPTDLAVTAQLGQFLDRMGQGPQAIPLLERVVAGEGENTAALINLGTLYAQNGRLEDAASLWRRALDRNPALTQARVNLAVALLKLGRRDEGVAALRTALRYDPDHQAAADLLRQVQ